MKQGVLRKNVTNAAMFSFSNALSRYGIEHVQMRVTRIQELNETETMFACQIRTEGDEYEATATITVQIQDTVYDTSCELHTVRTVGSSTCAMIFGMQTAQIQAHQLH